MVAFTVTAPVVLEKRGSEEVAVIVTLPRFTPVMVGWVAGAVWPAAIVTEPGEIVTLLGSLLTSVTVTAPVGTVPVSVTGNGTLCPNPRVEFEGTTTCPGFVTVTLAVALLTFASPEVAVTVAVPAVVPCIVTVTFTLF